MPYGRSKVVWISENNFAAAAELDVIERNGAGWDWDGFDKLSAFVGGIRIGGNGIVSVLPNPFMPREVVTKLLTTFIGGTEAFSRIS